MLNPAPLGGQEPATKSAVGLDVSHGELGGPGIHHVHGVAGPAASTPGRAPLVSSRTSSLFEGNGVGQPSVAGEPVEFGDVGVECAPSCGGEAHPGADSSAAPAW